MQVGLSVLVAIKEEVNKLDDWVNISNSHQIQIRIKKCNYFISI